MFWQSNQIRSISNWEKKPKRSLDLEKYVESFCSGTSWTYMRLRLCINMCSLMPTLGPCPLSSSHSECTSCQAYFLHWHCFSIKSHFILVTFFSRKAFRERQVGWVFWVFFKPSCLITGGRFLTTWNVLQAISALDLLSGSELHCPACRPFQGDGEGMYIENTYRLPAVTNSKSISYFYPKGWIKASSHYRRSALCALCCPGLCAGAGQEGRPQSYSHSIPSRVCFSP